MPNEIEKKIYNTFSEVAVTLGYSPLHGNIIGALLVSGKPMSLQEISKETGYSLSMISLSLDLLEVLGTIKKIKKVADRQLYVELHGDLLECLKDAIVLKVRRGIANSVKEFNASKEQIKKMDPDEREATLKKLDILEKEIKRLESYIDILSEINLP